MHFNYNLKPNTWRLLVNKQIYMKFEQLHIQKQLADRERIQSNLKDKIKSLEK